MAATKITSRVLADDAVVRATLGDDAIGTAEIADDAVTGALIADDVALAGNPTTTTQSLGNSSTRLATTAFVQAAVDADIDALIDSAPGTMNTLDEIAAALNDDPTFTTTVNNAIALKAPLANPTFTGNATFDSPTLYVDGSNNRVGIGNTAPDVLLEVTGAHTSSIGMLHIDSSDHAFISLDAASSSHDKGIYFQEAGTAQVIIDHDGSANELRIHDGTNTHMVIEDGGNVGIGTTAPATDLQIGDYSDNAETLTFATASDQTGRINFYNANASEGASMRVVGGGAGAKMHFANRYDSDADKVTFDLVNGRVGIGTTSPGYDLVVNNTGNSILQIKAGDTSWSALYFGEQSSAYRGVVQYNHNSDFMAIYTTGNEVMRLDTSGKVGIGTTSPAGMLDIPSGSYTATKPALMLGGNIDTTGSGTRTDNTRKYSSIVGYHYSNEEEPVGIMSYDCQSDSVAVVNIGVPSASYNSPTQISFYTGATSITASPSERMRMEATGKVNIGRNPSYLAQGSGYNALSLWGGHDNWDHFCCEMRSGGNGGILSCHSNNNAAKNYTGRATDNSVTFYVEGDGDYYFSGSSQSDRDTKENIADVPSGSLALVKQLRPRTFNFKQSADGAPLPTNPKTGFIAQEVESVFGTDDGVATGTDGSGRMGVDPTGIIAHLVNAIKELETRLAALE